MTTRAVLSRMNELYSTGVPVPFDCAFAGRVADPRGIELALHEAFGPYRLNTAREFFEISENQAVVILKRLAFEDATPEIRTALDKDLDESSKESAIKLGRKRRPNFDFLDMGIPLGSTLNSVHDEEICTVTENNKVLFRDEQQLLTAATQFKLERDYAVQPITHWTFEGRRLSEIYEETYPMT